MTSSRTGVPLTRTDFDHLTFFRNEGFVAGALNTGGRQMVSDQSDPDAALRASVATWSAVPTSLVHFEPLRVTSRANDSQDGQHVLVMLDTPDARSVVGDALAVTTVQYSSTSGRILDTDTVFNPDITIGSTHYMFSTVPGLNTFDLQTVATHELGHSLGANHSNIVGSTMFITNFPGATVQARLRDDDLCFLAEVYPAPGSESSFGRLRGSVVFPDGRGVHGAIITATDPTTGIVVGGITNFIDGSYLIARIPPGQYTVYAEPLAGPVEPSDLESNTSQYDTSFGTASAAGPVDITANTTTNAGTITVPVDRTIHIDAIGYGSAGGSGGRWGPGPMVLQPNRTYDFLIFGPGLDPAQMQISLLGPGLTLHEDTIHTDPGITQSGNPAVRFTVDVGSATGLATVLVTQGSSQASFSGGFVLAGRRPSFTAAAVANSAGFGGPGVAPGEILSIYGANLGPPAGVQNPGLDPETNALPASVAGTMVTFDGRNAPMFYVRGDQVNLQAPYEIAGNPETTIRVRVQDLVSDAVTVPVVNAVPGIYQVPGGGQGIVINQDNTVNTPSNPAERGSVITIYATGAGVVDPPVPTGQPAPLLPPLSRAPNPSATIGGQNAPVDFAGMTPNFAGLLQVNAHVPGDISPGSAVPIQISIGGVASQPGVTIAVR